MKNRLIAVALDVAAPWSHHQDVFAAVMDYARKRPNWRCVVDEHPAANARQGTTIRTSRIFIIRAIQTRPV